MPSRSPAPATSADCVDFVLGGQQYAVIVLVACKAVKTEESIRIWYGSDYSTHRTWDAVEPAHPSQPTLESDVQTFLNSRGLGFEDIMPFCAALDQTEDHADTHSTPSSEHGGMCGQICVPLVQPATVIVASVSRKCPARKLGNGANEHKEDPKTGERGGTKRTNGLPHTYCSETQYE